MYGRGCLVVLVLGICGAGLGCTMLESGRKYTFVKKDRDGGLIEAHRHVDDHPEDHYDESVRNGYISIVLNGGFLRYLSEVDRPELAIFARVRYRPTAQAKDHLVWEKVYLNSEAENENIVLNGDSFLPRLDIPILPGVSYEGGDILVSLRIIEMDQDDNQRTIQLVNAAASVGAAFYPESAVPISVFQTVLTFLIQNNPDDIEFQFDFAISQQDGAIVHTTPWGEQERYDLVLQPREASYAVIKTEHRDRTVYPPNYFDAGQEWLRFGVAQVLKVATLGLLNWDIWSPSPGDDDWIPWFGTDPDDDYYQALLGRPLATTQQAWTLPEFRDGQLHIENRDFWNSHERLRFMNDHLEKTDKFGNTSWFVDQSYLVLTVTSPTGGLNMETLQAEIDMDHLIEKQLGLRTNQLSPEQFRAQLAPVIASLRAYAAQVHLEEKYAESISKATTPEEIRKLKAEFDAEVAKLAREVMQDADEAAKSSLRASVDRKLALRERNLTQFRLQSRPYVELDGEGANAKVYFVHAPLGEKTGLQVSVARIEAIDGTIADDPPFVKAGQESVGAPAWRVSAVSSDPGDVITEVGIESAPPGRYRIRLQTAEPLRREEVDVWLVGTPRLSESFETIRRRLVVSDATATTPICGENLRFVKGLRLVVKAKSSEPALRRSIARTFPKSRDDEPIDEALRLADLEPQIETASSIQRIYIVTEYGAEHLVEPGAVRFIEIPDDEKRVRISFPDHSLSYEVLEEASVALVERSDGAVPEDLEFVAVGAEAEGQRKWTVAAFEAGGDSPGPGLELIEPEVGRYRVRWQDAECRRESDVWVVRGPFTTAGRSERSLEGEILSFEGVNLRFVRAARLTIQEAGAASKTIRVLERIRARGESTADSDREMRFPDPGLPGEIVEAVLITEYGTEHADWEKAEVGGEGQGTRPTWVPPVGERAADVPPERARVESRDDSARSPAPESGSSEVRGGSGPSDGAVETDDAREALF